MDQKTLRKIEKQCLQEEAPACRTACPLHVDVRTFVGQVSRGKWNDAWKTLNKTMPFPGILARICDHPCEASCLRHDLGGSIRISALEKTCVKQPKPRIRTLPMPPKNISMAVIGSEFSALVAALDLLRKGYSVTLFSGTDKLGEQLRQLSDDILPRNIMDQELSLLDSLGLQREKQHPSRKMLQELLTRFKAVYIGLEESRCRELTEGILPEVGTSALAGANMKGVFAGGNTTRPIQQAFEGRTAALSMERFAQQAGLSAGRQDEGPYSTRLFTNTDGIEPLPPVLPKDAGQGYTEEEAGQEAKRCIDCQCLECLKVCPYLAHYNGYPKRYAREIYNNASIVKGNHSANLMINSCSLCGLCTEICPENFSMATLCLEARRDMVQRNTMPPSAHEFALQDMEFSNSDHFLLHRHAKGQQQSRFAFFPGCQLSGCRPEKTAAVYNFLCANWSESTGWLLQCCGAPAYWAGNTSKTDQATSILRHNWENMGKPQLIVACSSCLEMLENDLPEINKISLWEILEQCELPKGAARFQNRAGAFPNTQLQDRQKTENSDKKGLGEMHMALHDPCTTRHAPQVQHAVRTLAGRLGIQVQELAFGGEKTECCGFGGLMQNANPEMARKQIQRRAAQSDLDYLAYCAMCRESLKGSGKRCAHLLDFLFPGEKETDPAARAKTGISDSRDNRVRLKKELVAETGKRASDQSKGVEGKDAEETEKIELHISPEIAARLEERRILHEDIRQTIARAEQSGQKMKSDISGHYLACYRPLLVTFWVEYAPAGTGYHIYNSYSHRMQIKKGRGDNA